MNQAEVGLANPLPAFHTFFQRLGAAPVWWHSRLIKRFMHRERMCHDDAIGVGEARRLRPAIL